MTAKGEAPALTRHVLTERHIAAGRGDGERVMLFGRAIWTSAKRAEFKAWVGKIPGTAFEQVPEGMTTRSRTNGACRDPLLAQEWAFEMWDEFVADVEAALSP